MLRRFLSLFAAFVVLFCISAPAFATGMAGGIGIPIVGNINLDVVDFANYIRDDARWCANTIHNKINSDICPYAPQLGGTHRFVAVRSMKDGQIGYYNQCEYCGKNYGDMLEDAYQDYVDELPSTRIDSNGGFYWMPSYMDGDFVGDRVSLYYGSYSQSVFFNGSKSTTNGVTARFADTRFEVVQSGRTNDNAYSVSLWGLCFTAPYDARYEYASTTYPKFAESTVFAGDQIYMGDSAYLKGTFIAYEIPVFRVTLLSSLLSDYGFTDDSRVNSVSGNGGGMYGYIGADGTLYQSSVGSIYDESTNVYNNPITGDTHNIERWDYDYSSRTYFMISDTGDSINVKYGDENVTINQGGTQYTVYYLAQEPQDVRTEPVQPPHVHDYSSTITTPPTCTGTGVRTYTCSGCGDAYTEVISATGHSFGAPVVTVAPTCTGTGIQTATCSVCGETMQSVIPATGHSYSSEVTIAPDCINTGVRTYTCSVCGDVYTQSISATGHRWQVVTTVPTVYDTESGQLVTEGYTLYECATCHEQYRIVAESGGASLPSPAPDGTSTGNTDLVEIDTSVGKGFLVTIARGLTEDLPEVLALVSRWFTVIPSLHEGFNKFLQQELSFFPPEVLLLFSFSIGVTVVVGFCRFLFRR